MKQHQHQRYEQKQENTVQVSRWKRKMQKKVQTGEIIRTSCDEKHHWKNEMAQKSDYYARMNME